MACGTPVVATQVGGLQHLVKDGITGFVVPHNDLNALEEKLSVLICNSDLRQKMSMNSVQYARSYSWDVITPKIIGLYRKTKEEFTPSKS